MKYDNITQATFLKRPNRFIAEVEIDGQKEIVHVKNTGRCKELLIPGCDVWLTAPGTPDRKTKYDLVAVRKDNGIIFNIDSQAPNKVVKEWLEEQDFGRVISEYTYGDSRIDFYIEKKAESAEPEKYLMEVKGCTLEKEGIGYFPDAPTERGIKHIRELIRAKENGYGSILAFVIQMDGVKEVRPNIDTHPEFGVVLDEARNAGVQVLYLTCHVEPDSLVIKPENSLEVMRRIQNGKVKGT
ncbi:MAG: DNA/RNA nuclease SfsA [Lachnospiraceae bacterium]|nr:DNA/RNA nuclease SfsA [Lachnospiraceae bacterium]